jgi:hypothetical protein
MSLAIDVDKVRRVLLTDGAWHEVVQQNGVSTFDIGAYEFIRGRAGGRDPIILVGGGQVAGVPSTGATWLEKVDSGSKGQLICCPLTSILAVDQGPPANK